MRENSLAEKENPKRRKNKVYFRIFGTAINLTLLALFISGCTNEPLNDQSVKGTELTTTIDKVFPENLADTVVINPVVAVTLKSSVSPSEVSASTLSLKAGTISVAGTVTTSENTINFTPLADLTPDTRYTATIISSKKGSQEHSWSFTTGKHRQNKFMAVVSMLPLKSATEIPLDIKPSVTFNQEVSPSMSKLVTISLMQGTTQVTGSVSYLGKTATFTPVGNLTANTLYTGKVVFVTKSDDDGDDDDNEDSDSDHQSASVSTWSFTTAGGGADVTPPTILSAVPANNASLVATSVQPSVTFGEAMNASTINTTNFTLKQGLTAVTGSVTYSGNTATFTPASPLTANTVYTGTITTGVKDVAGNAMAAIYSWSFTTSAAADATPPTVISAVPANNATAITTSTHPSVTFSEAINASSINPTSFTLKQGLTAVTGSVTYSGNTATFTPASALTANTIYTGTITTGVKDVAGNAMAANFSWSFTTAVAADVTPPAVLSVVPLSGGTSIAINSNVTATFSEAMNASTINATTFTLKQGTTAVAGSITYSGTTATFNPTNDLSGGTVYTATITTGTMDAAGNALAAAKTWSFTTIAAAPVVSFATQVLPILQGKCMPCHGATSPTAGISITNYTTVSKLSNSQIDNSGMYPKMGVTAAEQSLIKAWITAGRLNN